MFFEIEHKETHTKARTGTIRTAHGNIETPMFMPVGTQATVKSLDSQDLNTIGAQIILANTYHLHLRPGEDLIAKCGGLHKFMSWDKPLLTDSGGFQVFSLALPKKNSYADPLMNTHAVPTQSGSKEKKETSKNQHTPNEQGKLVSIDENGVDFRSHIDGSLHRFTPEKAIEIQQKLGADIIMAFDECTTDEADEGYAKQAMERTHRWAERCLAAHKKNQKYHGYPQYLFGIIQGGKHRAWREESARAISGMDFDGIAIGGESIGYNMEATKEILEWIHPLIPEKKPHYAMGVGFSPKDIFEVVERGIDMFDCVSPTRTARNGTLFVHPSIDQNYKINITNSVYKDDQNPIDPELENSPVGHYSRAYLHHLFKCEELLAYRIATLHNLYFLLKLMKDIRSAIAHDEFLKLKKKWIKD